MNRLLSLLALMFLVPLAPPAHAGLTSIADVPLLNISGTGTVKPNLMLLYDNSGSMTFNYTPDYVNNTGSCRARATIAGGIRGCRAGDPPFASADFNKQYYNPKVRYLPPVKADGESYPNQTAAETGNWTRVKTDAFNVDTTDLLGRNTDTTDLVGGFPDLRWCDNNGCGYNTSGYAYPNDSRYSPEYFVSNPYYYTINVAEYCTDTTLTNCRVTAVGAAAPAGYPEPARVRFCSDRELTRCQAKFVGEYKYPRFSDPNRNPDWYGTITIGASLITSSMSISSVEVVEPNGTFTLTNNAVTAASGTDTATKQYNLAAALAASIIARTGLANQYTACLRVASGSVPACSKFGINLEANNVVAVVPISCPAGSTGKAVGPCTLVNDGSRAGRDLVVHSGTRVTALLSISGTANGSKRQVLQNISYGGALLFSSPLTLDLRSSSSSVATQIKNKIGSTRGITAYVGGTSSSIAGPICAAASTSTVCLVSTSFDTAGANIALGSLSNNGSSRDPYLRFGATAGTSDGVPTEVTPLGASVFVRTDIVASRNSYPKDIKRTDCAGATCTYAEEMTNFANWYAYYKTRNQMMKAAVGQAFQPIADNFNVGIVSLSTAAAQGTIRQTPKPFTGTARTAWYSALYGMEPGGSTPVRLALHAVGKMFANREPYNYTSGNEVVQFPCQQNFTFVTTDGYWNGAAADGVVSNDNVEDASRFCSRAKGCVDPTPQTANSLADVALYWYNGGSNEAGKSLRPTLENWNEPNGLVAAAAGENTRLHMNTYALGLGVDGIMTYDDKYDTAPKPGSDFYKLITGVATGCPWNNNGPYVWPNPSTQIDDGSAALQARVDDLWHAAINGHGKYFSASDPLQVIDGLRAALSNIEVKIGAAAAAATSTPNISQQDNDIFSATFTTVRWYGELSDKKIDTVTGIVGKDASWTSSETVGSKVGADNDQRRILMLDLVRADPTRTDGLKNFDFLAMTDTEQAWFANKCSALAQCATLSEANRGIVNDGVNMVNWLRGQQQHANDTLLRAYSKTGTIPAGAAAPLPIVLGDIASSKPAYLRDPRKSYTISGYNAWKLANAGRQAAVFVAANDGMLHAFNATTGEEMWAYAPRITMKKLHLQASTTYGTNHQFTTDGSPEVADVFIGGSWRSVLVAGLNAGGRGYYAIDVTDPENPSALWELCADPAVCSGINYDADLGLSFGNPQFGTWVDAGNVEHWVVFLTSGYNNAPGVDGVQSGDGRGYLYVVDVATGRKLAKIATPMVGDKDAAGYRATPSGFARITAISSNPNTDPRVTYVYGGDNDGAMWRFDFSAKGLPTVLLMGESRRADGTAQAVTTRPDVTQCLVTTVDKNGNESSALERVVAFGTGRLLDEVDIADTGVQSAYVLKDAGKTIPASAWRNAATMAEQTLTRIGGVSGAYAVGGTEVDLSTQDGWYVDFKLNTGERVNLDPKIVSGGLNIVTNLPSSSSSCKVGGTSNVYQLNVCTAAPLGQTVTTGTGTGTGTGSGSGGQSVTIAGQTLSNSSAAVGFIIVRLPSGALKMITTTADGNTITSGVAPAQSEGASRAGWRRVRE